MFGTYTDPEAVPYRLNTDHPAIVYPLVFQLQNEHTAESCDNLAVMCLTGVTGCPWDSSLEDCIRAEVRAIVGFSLQERCNRIRAANLEMIG